MAVGKQERKRSSPSLRRLANDVSGTVGTRLITMVFGLITGVITARVLGPENRGIFSLVCLFPASLVTLSKFGQAQAAIYHIKREKFDPAQVAANVLLFGLGVGAVLIAVVLVFRNQLIGTILNGVPMWALLVVLPLIPILLLESYLYGILQATDRFRVFNTRVLAESILTMLCMAIALLVLELGLAGALGVAVGVRFLMALWIVYSVGKETPIQFRFHGELFPRMFRYGLKSHVQIIASHFHFKADTYMVAYFLGPTQVAFYTIAARLAEHIMYLPQSLGLALFPRLASASEAQVHDMTARACRQTLALTISVAIGLAFLGPYAISAWYGSRYAPAAAPLPYVCIGIVMMSLYVLLSRNFTSRNHQSVNITAAYIALGGNIALNLYLIPRRGIEGAAMATAASYSVSALLLFFFFLRHSGLPWHSALILRRTDLAMWRRLALDFWSDMRPGRAPERT